jgi:hypothetical protein
LASSLDLMSAYLQTFSFYWPLANKLLGTLLYFVNFISSLVLSSDYVDWPFGVEFIDEVRPWTWLHLGLSAVKLLLEQLRTLFDPKDKDPTHFDPNLPRP